MGQRIAALHQEFERIVETSGVGLSFIGDRPQLGDVVAEQTGRPINKYGSHYEAIGLHGVQVSGSVANNVISGNLIQGVTGSRQSASTTYGIVTRFEDGRDTENVLKTNNTFQNLDANHKAF